MANLWVPSQVPPLKGSADWLGLSSLTGLGYRQILIFILSLLLLRLNCWDLFHIQVFCLTSIKRINCSMLHHCFSIEEYWGFSCHWLQVALLPSSNRAWVQHVEIWLLWRANQSNMAWESYQLAITNIIYIYTYYLLYIPWESKTILSFAFWKG